MERLNQNGFEKIKWLRKTKQGNPVFSVPKAILIVQTPPRLLQSPGTDRAN
jgi:hypothetical protein